MQQISSAIPIIDLIVIQIPAENIIIQYDKYDKCDNINYMFLCLPLTIIILFIIIFTNFIFEYIIIIYIIMLFLICLIFHYINQYYKTQPRPGDSYLESVQTVPATIF